MGVYICQVLVRGWGGSPQGYMQLSLWVEEYWGVGRVVYFCIVVFLGTLGPCCVGSLLCWVLFVWVPFRLWVVVCSVFGFVGG